MNGTKRPEHCNQGRGIRVQRLIGGWHKQSAFADAVGIPQSTLSDIENSKKVKPEYITKIAKFLNIDEQQIIFFPDDEEKGNVINFENVTFTDSQPIIGSRDNSNDNYTLNSLDVFEKLLSYCKTNEDFFMKMLENERNKGEGLTELKSLVESQKKTILDLTKKLEELHTKK